MRTWYFIAVPAVLLLAAAPAGANQLSYLEQRVTSLEQQVRNITILRPIERSQAEDSLRHQLHELRQRVQWLADEMRGLQLQIDELKRRRAE